jgi:hypothetical protein
MRSLIFAACLLACAPAAAQRVSRVNGGKLMTLCGSTDVKGCEAYLSGVADAVGELKDAHVACIPNSVTDRQMREVVLKLLHNEPQNLERPGGGLVLRAYAKAWPCNK